MLIIQSLHLYPDIDRKIHFSVTFILRQSDLKVTQFSYL
jgi:hypothetical protein